MQVHPCGYYEWLRQPESRREREDKQLTGKIKQFWLESGCHSGYRNIHLDLMEAKISCGRDRVLRLMRAAGIEAQRGYGKPKNMYAGKPHVVIPNTLDRGFLFVAVVMDLYARNIVGWSMSSRMTDDIVLSALTMAYWRRKPANQVMLHSDQGSQYTSRDCQKLLMTLNIESSMSRRGNCWDNAVAESFFSNLKKEEIRRKIYKTRDDARAAVFNYIEMFYNPKRRHTHNDRVPPTVYEQQYFMKQESV